MSRRTSRPPHDAGAVLARAAFAALARGTAAALALGAVAALAPLPAARPADAEPAAGAPAAAAGPGGSGLLAAVDDGPGAFHRCRAGLLPADDAPPRAGTVRIEPGADRPYLLTDRGGCPTQRSVACQIGTPLGPGESVAVFHGFRQFVCVSRAGARGAEAIGWLPRRSVRTGAFELETPLEAWHGTWRGPAGRVGIRPGPEGSDVEVEVAALPPASEPAVAGAWLNGGGRPVGRRLELRDDFGSPCRLTLWLAGPLLVAAGDNACPVEPGFDGIYQRDGARF